MAVFFLFFCPRFFCPNALSRLIRRIGPCSHSLEFGHFCSAKTEFSRTQLPENQALTPLVLFGRSLEFEALEADRKRQRARTDRGETDLEGCRPGSFNRRQFLPVRAVERNAAKQPASLAFHARP